MHCAPPAADRPAAPARHPSRAPLGQRPCRAQTQRRTNDNLQLEHPRPAGPLDRPDCPDVPGAVPDECAHGGRRLLRRAVHRHARLRHSHPAPAPHARGRTRGLVGDRTPVRGPLLVALLGLAAACLLFTLDGPYWLLLVSRLLQGAAAGLGWVASLALIAASIPLERRGTYLGLAMSMVSIGTLAGPPLAGWISRGHGHAAPFVLAAAVLLVDGVLRVVFVGRAHAQSDDPATTLDVLRVDGSWPVVVLIALGSAVTSAIEPILPVRLAGGLGLDAAGIGLLFALLVITGAVLNPMVGAILGRVSPRLLAFVGAVLAVAGLMLLGIGSRLSVVIAGIVCLGAAIAFLVAPASTLIGVQGARTEPPALGGAYSLYNLAYAAGLTLGPALAGALTSALGYSAACAALAIGVAVVAISGFGRLPRRLSAGATGA